MLTKTTHLLYSASVTNPTQPGRKRLARLKDLLQRAGIRQEDVAEAAGVTKEHVNNVLNARDKSSHVVGVAKRLLGRRP